MANFRQYYRNKEGASGVRLLFVLNPEHDIALGMGDLEYTPPAQIEPLRHRFARMPLQWARRGDTVVLPADYPRNLAQQYSDEYVQMDISVIRLGPGSLKQLFSSPLAPEAIVPWGWDFCIRGQLARAGVPLKLMPSDKKMHQLRDLSHRNQTIRFLRRFNRMAKARGMDMDFWHQPLPREFTNPEECAQWLESKGGGFVKMPWSSSGRGVRQALPGNDSKALRLARGSVSRQGTVIAEPYFPKVLDFATEWVSADKKANFIGLSLFSTDAHGNYKENLINTQKTIREKIQTVAPAFGQEVIDMQREILESLITPHYHGPLGIDMMASADGHMRVCVEINLRMTMGHIALLKDSLTCF